MARASRLARWATALTTDPRSMAASRIALGLLVLVDAAERTTVLDRFYTDAGYVTRDHARQLWPYLFPHSPPPWSLHLLGGGAPWQILLLLLEAAAALALVVGFRARAASIATFVLVLSHCQRNLLVCDAQDWALVAFLLWAMAAPLDEAWALTPRGRARSEGARWFDLGSIAFALQLVMLLVFAGLQKLMNSAAWRSGEALSIVLGLDVGVTAAGRWIAATLPSPLLRVMSFAVLCSEIVAPWLLIAPVGRALRGAAIALIAANLLAFAVCLKVGLLPWVVLAALLSRVPGSAWETLGLTRSAPGPDSPRRSSTLLAPAVVTLALVHALLLNVFRLSGEFRGPPLLDALSGFLVPRQGWRMYSNVERSTPSTWIVLEGRPAGARGAIRLPDAAPLAYDPGSSTEALHGTMRERVFWTHAPALRRGAPEILDQVAAHQCSAAAIEHFRIVAVTRRASGYARSALGEYPCPPPPRQAAR